MSGVEQWARFRDGIPEEERTGSLVETYHRLLMNLPAIHEKAVRDWCDWEQTSLKAGYRAIGRRRSNSVKS